MISQMILEVFMTLGFLDQNFELHYENTVIKKSGEEKMLGITIDNI